MILWDVTLQEVIFDGGTSVVHDSDCATSIDEVSFSVLVAPREP